MVNYGSLRQLLSFNLCIKIVAFLDFTIWLIIINVIM